MGLSLSSAAAPELSLDALDAACRARGLDGEEIALTSEDDAEAVARGVSTSGARVVALRAEVLDAASAPAIARVSARLGVPVTVPPAETSPEAWTRLAPIFEEAGGRLLIGHRTNLEETLALATHIREAGASPALGLAWEIRPSTESLVDASAVLFAARDLLGLVRLYGGGPEQTQQDGRGIGPLLVDLALSQYAGPIVLCPSRDEERPRWADWLASKKSAGCGHRKGDEVLAVDVRDVEPKDRLETILGAYHSLIPGATMNLTVDHDPSCMYYTLEATEPEGSFSFEVLEHGPEVWRAEVKKR
jgi:uncharacterized protein (DUF2249 family)